MKSWLCIILTTLASHFIVAQADSTDFLISRRYYMDTHMTGVLGYNMQRNHLLELGLGIKSNGVIGHHPYTYVANLTSEIRINDLTREPIVGMKLSLWGSNVIAYGLNLINYTNFNESTLVFRPEAGIGLDTFRLSYGFNYRLNNKNFAEL